LIHYMLAFPITNTIDCLLIYGVRCHYSRYGSKELVSLVMILAAAVLWGLGDATFHTQFSALLGTYYPQDIVRTISTFYLSSIVWGHIFLSHVYWSSCFPSLLSLVLSIVCSSRNIKHFHHEVHQLLDRSLYRRRLLRNGRSGKVQGHQPYSLQVHISTSTRN
jgi:hypothetical protein